jgi:hypothetical protein
MNLLIRALSQETHATVQNAHAQYHAVACQARGERALARPWAPQYIHSPARSRPSLPLPLGTNDHHDYSYPLDMLASSPKPCRRRHYQSLPCPYREDATVASTPQTIIGRPFKRASSA